MSHFFMRSAGNYTAPNPNPNNFTIESVTSLDDVHSLVRLHYIGCTNFDGRKICIYRCPPKKIITYKFLDPHFSDREDIISPIARFPRNVEGERNAMIFLAGISLKKKQDDNAAKPYYNFVAI